MKVGMSGGGRGPKGPRSGLRKKPGTRAKKSTGSGPSFGIVSKGRGRKAASKRVTALRPGSQMRAE